MLINEIEVKTADTIFTEDAVKQIESVLTEGENAWSAAVSLEDMFKHIDSITNAV